MGQVETFTYNTDGTLASKTDFNGDTVSYVYDSEKRLTETHYPDTNSIIRVYEPITNRLISETDQNGTTSYEYYLNGSLKKVMNPDGTWISYTYDNNGNKLTVSTENGTTTYVYDALGRVSHVYDLQNRLTTYNYDTIGKVETVTYPNGIVETKSFDELGRTISVVNTRGVDIVSSYYYEVDGLGNEVRVTEGNGKVTEYSYDVLNRLTLESETYGGFTESVGYQYDSVGNRTVRENCNIDGCFSISLTYDANDRMTSDGNSNYTYYNNGNMLNDGNLTYSYNYENRMISAGTTDYSYNTRGVRTSKTVSGETTKYIVDMNKSYPDVVEELDSSNILKTRYEIGEKLISQIKNGNTSFYQYDGFGSTRALADDTGIITDTYDYNSFGVITAQTGTTENNYLYRNEQFDPETQTYYLRARQYSPVTGRFTQMDSWAGNLNNPITLNKYIYGNGNPVMYMDPSGRFSIYEVSAILAVTMTMSQTAIPVPTSAGDKWRIEIDTASESLVLKSSGYPIFYSTIATSCPGAPKNWTTPKGTFKAGKWQHDKPWKIKEEGKTRTYFWSKDPWKNPYGPWFLPINTTHGYYTSFGIHGTKGWGWMPWVTPPDFLKPFIDPDDEKFLYCSHGCVRNSNRDIQKLHSLIPNAGKGKDNEVVIKIK